MIFELGILSIVEERRQANTSNEFKKLHLGLLTQKWKGMSLGMRFIRKGWIYPDHTGNLVLESWALADGDGKGNSINKRMKVLGNSKLMKEVVLGENTVKIVWGCQIVEL